MMAPVTDDPPARLPVNTRLYTLEAVFRSCYLFTDRCYLFLTQAQDDVIVVEFRPRERTVNLQDVLGLFANELINQRLRADIAKETQTIREMIIARAFGDVGQSVSEP